MEADEDDYPQRNPTAPQMHLKRSSTSYGSTLGLGLAPAIWQQQSLNRQQFAQKAKQGFV